MNFASADFPVNRPERPLAADWQGNAGKLAAIPAVAVLAFLLFWVPSPLSAGDFSVSFVLPVGLAFWALAIRTRSTLSIALRGIHGGGLWIELACIVTALVFASLSILISPDPERAFRVLVPMSYGIFVMILFSRLPSLAGRRLVYAMIAAGVIVTAIGLVLMQLPPTRAAMMEDYRFQGFFQNPNQLALALGPFFPILVALLLTARRPVLKAICAAALLVFLVALIFGTKTGLGIALLSAALVNIYHSARSGTISRRFMSLLVVLVLSIAAIPIALWVLSRVSPIAFAKINQLIAGGFWNYQSIVSRTAIWNESIRLGLAHPLLGEGAGTKILEKSHSHNMILDYFRGLGIFGMLSAVVLLIVTAVRSLGFYFSTIGNGVRDRGRDTLIASFYLGALAYLIGNQISDSFSPSTAFAFWTVYICAYMSSLDRFRLMRADARRPLRAYPVSAPLSFAR